MPKAPVGRQEAELPAAESARQLAALRAQQVLVQEAERLTQERELPAPQAPA
jgi:hypothetical protein